MISWKLKSGCSRYATNLKKGLSCWMYCWYLGAFVKFAKSDCQLCHGCPSGCDTSAPTGTDFHEIWYRKIFKKSIDKVQVSIKSDKNTGYFTWWPKYIFYHISPISSEREIFQTKVVEKIKTHILCSVTFLFENRAVYEIMWKNIVEPYRSQMTI